VGVDEIGAADTSGPSRHGARVLQLGVASKLQHPQPRRRCPAPSRSAAPPRPRCPGSRASAAPACHQDAHRVSGSRAAPGTWVSGCASCPTRTATRAARRGAARAGVLEPPGLAALRRRGAQAAGEAVRPVDRTTEHAGGVAIVGRPGPWAQQRGQAVAEEEAEAAARAARAARLPVQEPHAYSAAIRDWLSRMAVVPGWLAERSPTRTVHPQSRPGDKPPQ
jgi:hypothetical protein